LGYFPILKLPPLRQVGIFGYTAYSASKFALRGLAEALQMELRPLGAAVTLAFPPDTDTPQLAFEVRVSGATVRHSCWCSRGRPVSWSPVYPAGRVSERVELP
jgi:NAD(P)-dependent dehydrogenase (short-subunit alcohol dehydrogenase family)